MSSKGGIKGEIKALDYLKLYSKCLPKKSVYFENKRNGSKQIIEKMQLIAYNSSYLVSSLC